MRYLNRFREIAESFGYSVERFEGGWVARGPYIVVYGVREGDYEVVGCVCAHMERYEKAYGPAAETATTTTGLKYTPDRMPEAVAMATAELAAIVMFQYGVNPRCPRCADYFHEVRIEYDAAVEEEDEDDDVGLSPGGTT